MNSKHDMVTVLDRNGRTKKMTRGQADALMANDAMKLDAGKVASVLRRRYGTPRGFLRALGIDENYVSRAVRKPAPQQLRPLMALLGLDAAQPQQPDKIQEALSALQRFLEEHVDNQTFRHVVQTMMEIKEMYAEHLDDHEHALNSQMNAATVADSDDQPPPFEGRPNRGGEPLTITGTPMLQASDTSPFGSQSFDQVLQQRGGRSPVGMTLDAAMNAKARGQHPRDSRAPFGSRIGQVY